VVTAAFLLTRHSRKLRLQIKPQPQQATSGPA